MEKPESPIPLTSYQKPIPLWRSENPQTGSYPYGQVDPRQNLGEPGSESCTGNPINMATGNKFQRETDIASQRVNTLEFARFYNSNRRVHWTHTYSTYLVFRSTHIQLVSADGLERSFLRDSGGTLATSTALGAGSLRKVGNGWEYVNLEKDVQAFDSQGRLVQWRGSSGYQYSLAYAGAVVTVTDSYGKKMTLEHDTYGRLTKVSNAAISVQYGYDSGGRLIAATRKGTGNWSANRQYVYDDARWPFHLTGLIDERGIRFATWSYDGRGRAISSEHAGGVEKVTLAYNDLGVTTLTNALGKRSIHTFQTIASVRRAVKVEGQASPNCSLSNSSFAYDEPGNLIERTDEKGVQTRYAYNALGLEISRTEAYGTAQARTIVTERDSDGVLPVAIREPGRQTLMTYDGQGRLLESMASSLPVQAGAAPVTTRYTYDAYGQVTRLEQNGTVTFAYDADGNMTSMSALDKGPYVFSNFTAFGQPKNLRLGNRRFNVTYTGDGKLYWMSEINADNIKRFSYTPAGDLSSINSNSLSREYVYDDARRMVEMSVGQGQKVRYTLDAAGNRLATRYLDRNGQTVGLYRETFDELNRRISSQWGDAGVVTYQYDAAGHLKGQGNSLNQSQRYEVDPWGQRTAVTDTAGGTAITRYDALGHVASVTDGRNNQTLYSHDQQGRTLRVESPDSGVRQDTYDAKGKLVRRLSANGVTTRFTYDEEGRLASRKYDGLPALDAQYSPQSSGWKVITAQAEDRYSLRPDDGSLISQLTFHREPTGTQRMLESGFTYDDSGNMTGVGVEDGSGVKTERNGNGQATSITFRLAGKDYPIASQIKYLPLGPVSELTWGNGSKLVRQHDTAYRLTDLTLGGTSIARFTYDAMGNITSRQVNDTQRSFAYDRSNRLVSEESDYKRINYTYDANGNRTEARTTALDTGTVLDTQSLAFAGNSNRLLSRNGAPVGLDAAGNHLDVNDGWRYAYDPENRLSEVRNQQGTKVRAYFYDDFGRRNATHSFDPATGAFSKATYYRYDPQGHLIAMDTFEGSEKVRKVRWVWLDDLPLAQIDIGVPYMEDYISIFYLHSDPLNTPRMAIDVDGGVVWSWNGSGYGVGAPVEEASGYNPWPTPIALRFPGQFSDAASERLPAQLLGLDTPLFYNYHRDYNPALGRYMQSDPIGLEGGMNTFAYAGGNPSSFVDVLGLALTGQGTSNGGPGGFPKSGLEDRGGPRAETLTEKAVKKTSSAVAKQAAKHVLESAVPGGGKLVGSNPYWVGFMLFFHTDGLGGCDGDGHCSDTRENSYQCRP